MAQLPTADEFFGSAPKKELPTADEFFGKPARIDGSGDVPQGTFASDMAWLKTTASKVYDAFGRAFGDEEIGLSEQSVKALKDYGVFNDYETGRATTGKALNEVLLRPAAYAMDVFLRGAAGVGVAAQEATKEVVTGVTGSESLGRDIAAMPEAFMGAPGSLKPRIVNLDQARRMKVIGHGEEGWRGTAARTEEPRPVEAVARPDELEAAPAIPDTPAVKPIEEQRAFIQNDVAQKLVAAGRPTDEANAAAAIDAAYWETRAARFEGKKGTAEEMYLRDAPEIVAGERKPDATPAIRDLSNEERRKLDDLIADRRQSLRPEKVAEELGVDPAVAGKALGSLAARGDPRLRQTKSGIARKPERGPLSLVQYLASIGGIKDQSGELTARGLNKVFVPGFGPLVRPKGRPLDAAREAVAEAGYMPEYGSIDDAMSRATIDDLLSKVEDDARGRKVWSDFDRDAIVEREAKFAASENAAAFKEAEEAARVAARDIVNVTEDEIQAAVRKALEEDIDPAEALADIVERNAVFGGEDQIQYARPERVKNDTRGTGEAGGEASRGGEAPRLPRRAEEGSGTAGVQSGKGGRTQGKGDPDQGWLDEASESFKALELDQFGDVKRGRIRLREEGRNTITLLREANASTFLHEKGHDYLARLIADASDEAAPAILKQDADITLKWLGVDKAEDIKTRHHEQFARGFEAYIREGVAPHPTLARVFEQFRQWLVRIYETVTRLKVDINDDIRGVYDRLLAVEPERTGIIPDEAIKKAAEKFGELAVSAEGPEAGILADAAGLERAKLADNAGLGGVTEEARLGTPGRADAGGIGPAPGPVAQPAGERAATGIAGAGRSEVAEKGARLPEDPNAPLPRTELPLTDKAGNIRLENLGVGEDVRAVIRQTAAENEGFISARRGVLSDAEVSDLADALGMDAKTLSRRKLGEAYNTEEILAARRLLVQSAANVRDLMAKAASGGEKDILAYAEARSRHLMIQEQVSGITAEWGRAGRSFRALIEGMDEAKSLSTFLQENTGKTLYQLQREAQLGMQLDTPAKVSKFVRDAAQPTWSDMVVEAWINALLSGPKTHVTNILGNTLVALYRVPETAVAAGVGKVRSAITGNKERVLLGEAGERLFGFVQGAKDGVLAGWEVLKNEDLVEQATKIEQRRFKAIPGVAGKIIRAPGRALSAEDQVFRGIAHRQELNALAYRRAMEEGRKGEAFERRVADLVLNPTEDMILAAKEAADYQTFQKKTGRMGNALKQFANSHPMVKFVIPFITTPLNIVKFAQERSLFGLFSREVRENIAKGGATADTQIARLVMGSAVSTAAIAMALEGTITGGGPSDPRERALLFQTGWQPYSVKIGEHYYSYARLEPIAMLFGIAADMAEIGQETTQKEADEIGKLVLASVAKNLTSKTWLSGPSELIKAVHDPDRYGQRYIQRFAGTVVPTGLAQIAQTQDPYLREARNILDTIKSRVPGLSQTLLPRRDVWGEPIELEGGLGPDLLSPIYESRLNNDPVNQTLLRLGVYPSRAPRKIRGVELTEEQYDDFARIAGRTTKMRLDAIVNLPGFESMPEFAQRELVTRTIDTAREASRSMMMMQHPEIIEKAMEAKQKELSGR